MRLLPDIAGSRYGSVALGYDRVTELRREHALLIQTVALAMGEGADALTVEAVEAFLRDLQARAQAKA
jgi:hypothetical protein